MTAFELLQTVSLTLALVGLAFIVFCVATDSTPTMRKRGHKLTKKYCYTCRTYHR